MTSEVDEVRAKTDMMLMQVDAVRKAIAKVNAAEAAFVNSPTPENLAAVKDAQEKALRMIELI